ncbi:MAG: ribosomal-protein-alanine N-acetyltransferase [Patiriisocius sp.]
MNCPTLLSERLILRPLSIEDLSAVHNLHSLPETDEFNTLGIPKDIDETEKVITPLVRVNESELRGNFTWAIESKDEHDFIGLIAMNLAAEKFSRAEVWYKLDSKFWKNGYATESVKRLLSFGFNDLDLHRIEAGCAVGNLGSLKVLEKAGMIKEGRTRQRLPLKTGWSDGFDFGMLKSEYLEYFKL